MQIKLFETSDKLTSHDSRLVPELLPPVAASYERCSLSQDIRTFQLAPPATPLRPSVCRPVWLPGCLLQSARRGWMPNVALTYAKMTSCRKRRKSHAASTRKNSPDSITHLSFLLFVNYCPLVLLCNSIFIYLLPRHWSI